MVDEAHSFKNFAIFSKMNNVSGISSTGAKKSNIYDNAIKYASLGIYCFCSTWAEVHLIVSLPFSY